MIPNLHRDPLRKVIWIDPFHITVPKKITVRMKIDRIQGNRFQQFHESLLVVGFFPEDHPQLTTFHELKWAVRRLHELSLSMCRSKIRLYGQGDRQKRSPGTLSYCSQEQSNTSLGIPPVTVIDQDRRSRA